MKTLIVTLVLMLACCGIARSADVNEPYEFFTVWLSGTNLAYHNTDLSVWLGYRHNLNEDFDVEIGPAINWRMWSEGDAEEKSQSNLALGAYAAVHALKLIDVPNPLPFDYLPAQLLGEPFVSIEYLIDTDGQGSSITPACGIRVFEVLAVVYRYRMVEGEKVPDGSSIAISTKFKF